MATSIGKNLGNYTVEGEIGCGGMGQVLLARQNSLDRPAVLKKIRRDLCELPELAERLAREARTAAAIHHPNVVCVYDCFSIRGNQYIAQEYVDGVDLKTTLERCGALPWRIAALIALEVSRGLEEIHTLGTVHRDLKPQNILIGRRGEVKIADFGLALEATGSSLTKPGVMIGSPTYMPPEQMLGERVDARCDLFSFGVVFYEALTNCLPYPSPEDEEGNVDEESLLARMQRGRHVRLRKLCPSAPRSISRLIQGCLRPKVKQRLASAAQIRRRLERRLGPLSPSDLRSELASWLWERQLFATRENETVVLVSQPRDERRRWSSPRIWLAAAAAVTSVLLALQILLGEGVRQLPWATGASASREAQEEADVERTRPSDEFGAQWSLARSRFSRAISQAVEPDAD
jgi:serine/threonine protein kinase